jgi:hypothetical protein
MKRLIYIFLFFLLASPLLAQQQSYRMKMTDRIEGKNYYFTALLSMDDEIDAMLQTDKVLSEVATDKMNRLQAAVGLTETLDALTFSASEIETIADELAKLYKPDNAMGRLLRSDIIPSGCYAQAEGQGAELIKNIFRLDAKGMNRAIGIYVGGDKPNYPAIDSIGFYVQGKYYQQEILPTVVQNVLKISGFKPRFYSVPLHAVSVSLDMNDRCQMLDFEPLHDAGNAESYRHVPSIDFNAYPYSAILVLGAGPNDISQHISPEGRMRASYAAMLYSEHKAPFIIVSGGRVHPYHTPYNEAEEMKKYIVEKWNIPAWAIIMEPHARHTTTNIRNANRILFREGFPFDKKVLVTSSESHIDYVMNDNFVSRFKKELNLVPFRICGRPSLRTCEYIPQKNSLIINPDEPLDP